MTFVRYISRNTCLLRRSLKLANSVLKDNLSNGFLIQNKTFSSQINQGSNFLGMQPKLANEYIDASDNETFEELSKSMLVYENFISETEEESLFQECENFLKRQRYQSAHWDDAIHSYRELERTDWNTENSLVIARVKRLAFSSSSTHAMPHVHVLDLHKEGYIKPHVDSVRFCGDVIAGLCLLSPCVMRLIKEHQKSKMADCLLPRRALYIMSDEGRYDYTHEVLKESDSVFKGNIVERDRRISVICRCEPDPRRKQSS